jgi:hypothetical protein
LFSPVDPRTLYYAANKVYKTRDGGANWEAISPDLTREEPGIPPSVGMMHGPGMEKQRGAIYALSASSRNADILWAGTDDGLIWKTVDGGKHWSNVTPDGMPVWSKVTQIDASHYDENTVYVSVSRMRVDDLHPYIYRSHDGGRSWNAISAGLPREAPVNAVREDPRRRGMLFAATEKSVWMSWDDGDHWASLQINLPHTSMRDLWIQDDDLIVATHGRSVWILDDISVLRRLAGEPLKNVALVRPPPAYRVAQSTWPDTPIPPDEPLGANPPSGAIIDYFFPRDAKGLVKLEVLDAKGNLVRRFASDDALKPTEEELARELIPAYWIATPTAVPTKRGMHRWIWNLHYPDPDTTTRGYPISAVPHATPQGPLGPVALPGDYVIRLTVEDREIEVPLTVKPDPRVPVPSGALEEQFALASGLAKSLSESSRALLAAQSEHQQLRELAQKRSGDPIITSYDKRLSALLGSGGGPPQGPAAEAVVILPDVQGQIEALYNDVLKGDAAPTAVQARASEAAQGKLAPLLETWKQLQSELPALNRKLRSARLAPVRPELPPPRDLNVADED